ncbi:iron-siderophore ABC transporter substrate-binding protein [Arcanobacterium bovis]|uniref:Iron-siderophore ABC transporter substrate-binding protein n=1 Tax=Arcanobacterium bovis TaxID=2529275 RepID=A0A4Q9V0B9_9ACTO|nr:iron-siderophore ABC transporter substrate-binding protein [Arcanobacterium bovis]TBW20852.1 iron-siderophore ABC transporter substrate-binding protein [Arcanobacterium bovis]
MKKLKKFTAVACAAFTSIFVLTGCGTSTTSTGHQSSTSDAPVEIKHQYGTTTVKNIPQRIATVSWVNTDTVLAFDAVPVGVPAVEWGGNKNKSTDWIDSKLKELGAQWGSSKAPKQYSEVDGINFEAIAQVKPDLIVAAYSGMSKEQYDKLSKIAPVIGPIEPNYTTKWQDATRAVGKALRQEDKATKMITDLETKLKNIGEKNNFKGINFIAGNLDLATNNISIYTGGDTRGRFFSSIGLTEAPVVTANTPASKFFFDWSPERADELKSDIFYSWISADTKIADVEAHPLFGQIPAVKNRHLVVTNDDHATLSISAASVLSLPWAIDNFVPQIIKTVQNIRR